jgi:hypothetical protein
MDIFDKWANDSNLWNDLKCRECQERGEHLSECKGCHSHFCKKCRERLREEVILSRIEDTPTQSIVDEYFKVYSAVYNPKNRTKTTDRAIQKRIRAELEPIFPQYSKSYYRVKFNLTGLIWEIEVGKRCPHKRL